MVKSALNSQTKYKLVTVSFLSSFAVIIFCLYYLKGLAVNIKTARINIAETQRDIVLLDKVIKDKSQYASDIDKIKNILPSKYVEIAFFTTQLEALAENNNIAMQTSIDQKAVEEKDTNSSIGYKLTLNGSFSSIFEFLSGVVKLPYLTIVDDLKMSAENGGLVCIVKIRLFVEK